MEGLDEVRSQAREEQSGANIHPQLTPMPGQLGMSCWSWSAATAFSGLLG